MAAPALIGLDWGTSALRGYLIAADGTLLERSDSAGGILAVPDGGFAAAFAAATGDWIGRHGRLPVLASGMIGSRQGWREVPYVDCPAGEAELARGLVALPQGDVALWLAPGLAVRDADGIPDVMRGEETQIIGTLPAEGGAASGLYVLPGSHSKWVRVDAGRIDGFATFMTGELYAALKGHTILGRTMSGEAHDAAAFARGVGYGRSDSRRAGGLLKRLFSARTLALFDALPATAGASYLSGLLIGSELREARAALAAGSAAMDEVTVVGRSELAERYRAALSAAGVAVRLAAADAAATGQWRIARAAGLLAA